MELELRSRKVPLTPELREHVARRGEFALGRFRDNVRRVTVRLGDVNGPKGGVDKVCHVSVKVRRGRAVELESAGTELFAAIDSAFERASQAVARELERRKRAQREPLWKELLRGGTPLARRTSQL